MKRKPEEIAEQLYEFLADESGEERACDAISEDSCHEVPGNFFLNAINGFSSKLAEQIASPELVIPWVFALAGVPTIFSGLLVPVKNAGSLLPQLIVSAKIRAFARRKYFWSGAAVVQAVMLLLMAWAMSFEGVTTGIMVVAALLLFSMASGVASIAFKDVMGKTIPKGKRGKLLALRATGGGLLTIVAGLIFYFFIGSNEDYWVYQLLFVSAAVLWGVAALLFALIQEAPGATSGGRKPIEEFKNGINILREDANFRRFLVARGLMLSIPLVQPFLILYAQKELEVSLSGLGLFVIVTGISNSISSPFWGRFADRSSKNVMAVGAIFAAIVCGYVLMYSWVLPADYQSIYTFSPVFFLIIIAYGGVRMGRKTYLVDYAPDEDRPLYVSVANTSIGILVLLSGVLSVVASVFGVQVMIGVLSVMMLVSAAVAYKLKNA
ncbi:MFS transporter [Marinoscillum furvescens]|uniref:Putative MFS family arabinose efflux permease n=1 Tax=Marinoscillum furvescens DSM 4134 TaxID=1122208 RepID=A0A3D9L415_MARFU|nr:MFS transporter [Marinoscillum furvescens]RED99408.1 putative MFS family arabinose efflux permease [Marinoscillum furvescens DSM 4134]